MSDTPGAVERWVDEHEDCTASVEWMSYIDGIAALAFARAHDAEDARRDAVIAQAREALRRGGAERNGEWHRFTCLDDPCSYVCTDQRAALAAIDALTPWDRSED